jgi:hypothetical protein
MLSLCFPYAFPILFLCFSYAFPMLSLCFPYAFPMLFRMLPPCFPYAFPMLFLCFSYASPMLFLCFPHAFPMLSLCFSYAVHRILMISMNFQCDFHVFWFVFSQCSSILIHFHRLSLCFHRISFKICDYTLYSMPDEIAQSNIILSLSFRTIS